MQAIHKNIINKWLKLYLYSYDSMENTYKQNVKFHKNFSLYFKSSNEYIQIKFVQQYGHNIKYINNPSENVKLSAVNC